ncbi:Ig-like domain-containing protein, partial [Aeromonas salmonicida subsp. salmonicida]
MNNPRLRLPALIGAIAAITAGSANADLLAYRFATPSGEQKSLSSGAIYANPVGNMTFSVSAGIDRKVKVSILRADGSVVSSAISSLLGATDRITVGGNSYYGAELVIPAPAEGEYQIKSEILSSQGGVIQSASERLVIDTTAPIISGDFTFNVSGWTWGRIDIFGPDNINNTISIGGITDAGSGAVSAKYFAIDPQGVKRSKAVALTKNTPASITFYANDASGGDVAPTNRAEYEIGVEVADAAGNIAKKTRVSAIDRTMPPYSVEVWNSQSGVWQPYESAASYENPIKFRTKIAKADHVDFNGTKYGLKFSYNNQDANFVYNEGAVAIPSSSQSYWNIQTLSGVYQNFYFSSLNGVKLGGAAQQGPQAIDFSYGVAGMPMVSGTSPTIKTPSSIDRYTTTVEPRPYDQTVSVNGASCVIPAGSQSCTLNPNVTFTSGRGYIPYPVYVRNGSGSLTQHATYLYTYWDFNPPVINSAVWDASTKTAAVRVIDSDRINNWQIGMWDTRDIGVDAIDEKGGRIPLKLKKSYDESYNTKNREFTTTGIPDGKYTLEAVSVDTYGNTARKVISQIVIDNTAPNLVIQAPQGGVPSLDDIQINVTDALSDKPSITSVNLKGGPSSDNVFLSVRAISANLFKLEYPVMFPSLKAGESYSLTVIAQDDQGNQATKGINFNYTPRQVRLADGMDGKLMIPAVTQEFIHADGSKIIETEPLTLNDGSTVTGSYDVFATLRTDAKVPLVVNGVRIEPGQTMGIMSKHNFGASKGRLSIPMKPAVPDVVGSSGLLVTTAAPNSPILVLDVTTWKPTAKLSAESWMVRQVIDPV